MWVLIVGVPRGTHQGMNISSAAAMARENARQPNGQFGSFNLDETQGIDLSWAAGETPSYSIDNTATIGENVTIGEGAVIEKDAYVASGTVIGENAIIGEGVSIQENCTIGAHTKLKRDTEIAEDVVIGENCSISDTAIGPHVTIAAGSTMTDSTIAEGTHLEGRVDSCEIGPDNWIHAGLLSSICTSSNVTISTDGTIADRYTAGFGVISADTTLTNVNLESDYLMIGEHVTINGPCTAGQGAVIDIANNVRIDSSTTLSGDIVIGENTLIAAEDENAYDGPMIPGLDDPDMFEKKELTTILENATIGKNCRIEEGARVLDADIRDGATLHKGTTAGSCSEIGQGSIIGARVEIEPHAIIGSSSRIDDGSHIGRGSVVADYAHVRENTRLENGALFSL